MTGPWRTVLVGTDGSLTAGRAVARAAALAARLDCRMIVAYVGDPERGRPILDGVRALYGDQVDDLDARLLGGDPADALVGLAGAEHVDVLVVGNKGMAGAQRFLLGSVPNRVTHNAPCDVLVVHTTG